MRISALHDAGFARRTVLTHRKHRFTLPIGWSKCRELRMKFIEAFCRVVARFRHEIRAHRLGASEAERHRAHVSVVEHAAVEAHFVDVAAEGAAAWQHRADRKFARRIEARL